MGERGQGGGVVEGVRGRRVLQTRTGANHGDGRLYVDPLVRVDTGVDEDEAVEVALLHASQGVFDGVVVLRGITGNH